MSLEYENAVFCSVSPSQDARKEKKQIREKVLPLLSQKPLGVFQIPKENLDIRILFLGYEFNKTEKSRKESLDADWERLNESFEKYQCTLHKIIGYSAQHLLIELSEEQRLRDLFDKDEGKIDMLIVILLTHGMENGDVETDKKKADGSYETFNIKQLFEKLANNPVVDEALQLFLLGPCRGDKLERQYVAGEKPEPSNSPPPMPLISNEHARFNRLILYATLEGMKAFSNGCTWLVKALCDQLDNLEKDVDLCDFLTCVSGSMHEKVTPGTAQTSQLNISPHNTFTLKSLKGTDAGGDCSNVGSELNRINFFTWKSDTGDSYGPGKGIIFHDDVQSGYAQEMKQCLGDLGFSVDVFEIRDLKEELERTAGYLEEEGLLFVCVFAKLEHGTKGYSIFYSPKETRNEQATDVTSFFVGERCPNMCGKPKIFCFLDCEIGADKGSRNPGVVTKTGNNYSDTLCFYAKGLRFTKKLLEQLKDPTLKNGKSILQVLKNTMNCSGNSVQPSTSVGPKPTTSSHSGTDSPLIVSTMSYLIDIPNVDPAYQKPHFEVFLPIKEVLDCTNLFFKVLTCCRDKSKTYVHVLSNERGTGKTRATKELAKYLRSNKIDVVEINAKTNEEKFLKNENMASIVQDCIHVDKKYEEMALLLDDIDELPLEKAVKFINQAAEAFHVLWITAKPRHYDKLIKQLKKRNVTKMALRDFDETQVNVFLRRSMKGVDWTEAWKKISTTLPISWSPRLLQMVAEVLKEELVSKKFNLFHVYRRLLQLQAKYALDFIKNNESIFQIQKIIIEEAIRYMQGDKKLKSQDNDVIENFLLAHIKDGKLEFLHHSYPEFLMSMALFLPESTIKKMNLNLASILTDAKFEGVRFFIDLALLMDFTDADYLFDVKHLLANATFQDALRSDKILKVAAEEGLLGFHKKIALTRKSVSSDFCQFFLTL